MNQYAARPAIYSILFNANSALVTSTFVLARGVVGLAAAADELAMQTVAFGTDGFAYRWVQTYVRYLISARRGPSPLT